MRTVEITVPDIGDFTDIPVIEVLINPGDKIEKEAPLVTLESDKATMEVPADASGTIRDVKIKVGDRVSKGSILATVEVADDALAATGAAAPAPADSAASEAPAPESRVPASEPSENAGVTPPSGTNVTPIASSGEPGTLELLVPDIGDFHDIPVIEVLIKNGDLLAAEAAVVTLESEKATMEVPASSAGTVKEVKVKVGDRVSKGTLLAILDSVSAAASGSTAAPVEKIAPSTPVATPAPTAEKPAPTLVAPSSYGAPGNANGNGTNGVSGASGNGTASAAKNGSTHSASAAGNGKVPASIAPLESGTPAHASPGIRRFARELGVDLARLSGTGPNGRITRDDVQGFVKQALATPAAPVSAAPPAAGFGLGLPAWPKVDFAKFGPVERQPLSRIQKLSGPNLARNWVTIPHVTQNEDADVTDLEAFRKSVNAEGRESKVTMLAFLIKACVAVLTRFPDFNSSLDGDDLVVKRYYHIGFAADTPQGLVVPVIRDADRKGVLQIARETAALAAKARDGKLSGSDMQGGTFSISSLGGIGGTYFTPIINAPEVAILGVSRMTMKPVWDGSAFIPRQILPLSLSYDHRVIDGATAARFIVALASTLGDLRRTLL